MSKRTRTPKKTKNVCITGTLGSLPVEFWTRYIWPLCKLDHTLKTVSQAWVIGVKQSVTVFAPGFMAWPQLGNHSLCAQYLGQFTNVERFVLRTGPVKISSAWPALRGFKHLHTLTIYEMNIQLVVLPQLTALDWRGDAKMYAIAMLPNLCVLVTDADDTANLQHCTSLTSLELRHTSVDITSLSHMTKLQSLNLWSCTIHNVSALNRLHSLVFLELCNISSASSLCLMQLTNLTCLDTGCVRTEESDIVKMTQLRALCFRESTEKCTAMTFNADSFSRCDMTKLMPLTRFIDTELRLACHYIPYVHWCSKELMTFTDWHRPLPPNYFSTHESSFWPLIGYH
jgi:hypothetical protein